MWQRDYYYRQMVRWWLFSGLSCFSLAIGIITRCSPVLPGHGPTIGGHCRVVAHSLTGEVVTRIMLEIQDIFFFFSFFFTVFTGARFRLHQSLSEYKTNRKNKRKMENREQKNSNRGNENRKVSKGKEGKRQACTVCLSVCPWINLVKNVRIEFLLWLRHIN